MTVRASRTFLAAVLYLLGAAVAGVVFGACWCAAAVRLGWRDTRTRCGVQPRRRRKRDEGAVSDGAG